MVSAQTVIAIFAFKGTSYGMYTGESARSGSINISERIVFNGKRKSKMV
jgi:hypothetical protein